MRIYLFYDNNNNNNNNNNNKNNNNNDDGSKQIRYRAWSGSQFAAGLASHACSCTCLHDSQQCTCLHTWVHTCQHTCLHTCLSDSSCLCGSWNDENAKLATVCGWWLRGRLRSIAKEAARKKKAASNQPCHPGCLVAHVRVNPLFFHPSIMRNWQGASYSQISEQIENVTTTCRTRSM